jgi:hypothetical protein
LLKRVHELQNHEFPAPPVSSPAGGLNTSARASIRREMIESTSILDVANAAKTILAISE